jgi:hypothetical protein
MRPFMALGGLIAWWRRPAERRGGFALQFLTTCDVGPHQLGRLSVQAALTVARPVLR